MAGKLKLTRPELKRQREALTRFQRYLPMLKLKQQLLQSTMQDLTQKLRAATAAVVRARSAFEPYRILLADRAGLDVERLAVPSEIKTSEVNIAGVAVPIFEGVSFAPVSYSLFATPPWVDRAVADTREVSRRQAEVDILQKQYDLLQRELTKIIQRVNLFEKLKIPQSQEAIRVIRIHLGDQMTAAVGRAKIAKAKISQTQETETPAGHHRSDPE